MIKYDKNQEPIVISKYLIEKLLKTDNFEELYSLYSFYYYTAKWQEANIVKATNSYVAKGLKWSEKKVIKYKQLLIKECLIENVRRVNEKNITTGWFIKVLFVWSAEKVQTAQKPQGGLSHRVEKVHTNALSVSILNALSVSILNALNKKEIKEVEKFIIELKTKDKTKKKEIAEKSAIVKFPFLEDESFKQFKYMFESSEFIEYWLEFEKVRKKKKASNSNIAYKSLLNKLHKFSGGLIVISIEMIEKSIISGWSDIYELKTNYNNKSQPKKYSFETEEQNGEITF